MQWWTQKLHKENIVPCSKRNRALQYATKKRNLSYTWSTLVWRIRITQCSRAYERYVFSFSNTTVHGTASLVEHGIVTENTKDCLIVAKTTNKYPHSIQISLDELIIFQQRSTSLSLTDFFSSAYPEKWSADPIHEITNNKVLITRYSLFGTSPPPSFRIRTIVKDSMITNSKVLITRYIFRFTENAQTFGIHINITKKQLKKCNRPQPRTSTNLTMINKLHKKQLKKAHPNRDEKRTQMKRTSSSLSYFLLLPLPPYPIKRMWLQIAKFRWLQIAKFWRTTPSLPL